MEPKTLSEKHFKIQLNEKPLKVLSCIIKPSYNNEYENGILVIRTKIRGQDFKAVREEKIRIATPQYDTKIEYICTYRNRIASNSLLEEYKYNILEIHTNDK